MKTQFSIFIIPAIVMAFGFSLPALSDSPKVTTSTTNTSLLALPTASGSLIAPVTPQNAIPRTFLLGFVRNKNTFNNFYYFQYSSQPIELHDTSATHAITFDSAASTAITSTIPTGAKTSNSP